MARAQKPTVPVIGYLGSQSADDEYKNFTVPFLQGLKEAGYSVDVATDAPPDAAIDAPSGGCSCGPRSVCVAGACTAARRV